MSKQRPANQKKKLYVDGVRVAQRQFEGKQLQLRNSTPFKIGFGQHDYFNGRMRDLRIFKGALPPSKIRELARQ